MAIQVCARMTDEIFDPQEFPNADDVTVTKDTLEVNDEDGEPIRVYDRNEVIWWEP